MSKKIYLRPLTELHRQNIQDDVLAASANAPAIAEDENLKFGY